MADTSGKATEYDVVFSIVGRNGSAPMRVQIIEGYSTIDSIPRIIGARYGVVSSQVRILDCLAVDRMGRFNAGGHADPSGHYCRHQTNIGAPLGADILCGRCEDGE